MKNDRHSGVCRVVRTYWAEWVQELSATVEREFEPLFAEYDVDLKILPIRISHLSQIGEGLELSLDPHNPKGWWGWGEFESDIEIRRRRRLSRTWSMLVRREEVEEWLREETQAYLARLRDLDKRDE